jgi:hypothetical protein
MKCKKCGKDLKAFSGYAIINYYPVYGFPHDTEKRVCEKCKEKFKKYITKHYNKFFEQG